MTEFFNDETKLLVSNISNISVGSKGIGQVCKDKTETY